MNAVLRRTAGLIMAILLPLACLYRQGPPAPANALAATALTINDGLPQGYISGIAQDSAGFRWLRSTEFHFSALIDDGGDEFWLASLFLLIRFRRSSGGKLASVSIPAGEWIVAAGRDGKGIIWVATQKAIYTLRGDTLYREALWKYTSKFPDTWKKLHPLIDRVHIARPLFQPDGCLLFATLDGVFRYNTRTGRQAFMPFSGVDGYCISGAWKSGSGAIYINRGRSIFHIEPDNALSKVWENDHQLPSMIIDRQDNIWAGTNAHGLRLLPCSLRVFTPRRAGCFSAGLSNSNFSTAQAGRQATSKITCAYQPMGKTRPGLFAAALLRRLQSMSGRLTRFTASLAIR